MILCVDSEEFLKKAMNILDKYGTEVTQTILGSKEVTARVYSDSLIRIIMSDDGKWGEMERMANRNPFFMKYDGDIIRFHGEFAYLEDHLNNLLGV